MSTMYKHFEGTSINALFTKFAIIGYYGVVPQGLIFCTHLTHGHPKKTLSLYVKPHDDLIDEFMSFRGGKEHDIIAMVPNSSNNFVISYLGHIGSAVVGHVPHKAWYEFREVAVSLPTEVVYDTLDYDPAEITSTEVGEG